MMSPGLAPLVLTTLLPQAGASAVAATKGRLRPLEASVCPPTVDPSGIYQL